VTVVTNGRRFQGDESCRVQMADNEVDLVEEDAVRFLGPRGRWRASSCRAAGCSRRR
jgi:hypothetical protein